MATLFKSTKSTASAKNTRRYVTGSFWVTIGFLLSPLSWWNDLVVNVPLAYVFSIPFTFIDERLFLPAFVAGYWFTNLLGFILMHKGVAGFFNKQQQQQRKARLLRHFAIASIYSLVILLLVWLGWIPTPADIIDKTTL